MDIELLKTFLELNRTRHFGQTAKNMHLSQAAISSRIKQLEKELNVVLFDRSSRTLERTPQGTRLVTYARQQISAWDIAKKDISVMHTNTQLFIASNVNLCSPLVQEIVVTIRNKYPDIALSFNSYHPESITNKLIEGTLDFAVVLEPLQLEIMQNKKIATIEFVCVSNDKATVLCNSCFAKDYIHIDWGISHDLDFRRTFPDAPEPLTHFSEATMAIHLILSLGGCAYVPITMVQSLIDKEKLFIVQNTPTLQRNVYLTYLVRSSKIELIEDIAKSI